MQKKGKFLSAIIEDSFLFANGKSKIKPLFLIVTILVIFISLFFISLTLAQSFGSPEITYHNSLENRTDVSDTYLIKTTNYKNGTILRTYETHFYTHPVNIIDNGTYKQFTDVVNLRWDNFSESFILSWQGKEIRIKPLLVDNQNDNYTLTEIKNLYPSLVFNPIVEKTKKYLFGIKLSNISEEFQEKLRLVQFSLTDVQGIALNDIATTGDSVIIEDVIDLHFIEDLLDNFNYSLRDKDALVVDNVVGRSEVDIDMIAGLE